jgi:hypothetical protein
VNRSSGAGSGAPYRPMCGLGRAQRNEMELYSRSVWPVYT